MNSCLGTAPRTDCSADVSVAAMVRSPPFRYRAPRRSPRRSSSRSARRSARGTSRVSAWRRWRPKSSTDSQRQPGMPNASASLTKSGLVKSTPKWRPNFLSCFQTIEPNCAFSQMMLTTGVRSRTAVSSSWKFISTPPSPLTVTTLRSGCTSLAAIPHGTREAHPGQAVGDQHRVGLMCGEHAADPQLVQTDVADQDVGAAERLAQLPQHARRLHREGVVVLGGLEAAQHDVAQARASRRCGARGGTPRPGGVSTW